MELQEAMRELHGYAAALCDAAGYDEAFLEQFWNDLCGTEGLLREFAYYYDRREFLCDLRIAGKDLSDMMIWQVDHFKAYLDRGDEMLRYDSAKLLLQAFSNMAQLNRDPEPILRKMATESGTDSPDKY